MFLALLVDVLALTAQLHLGGGLANPFVFVYLLQLVLAAVLLRALSTWTLLCITGACLALLALFHRPRPMPLDPAQGLASPYVQGLLVCLALDATLLVYLVRRISANLRARDAHLAACASMPPKRNTSCAWACWHPVRPMSWAHRCPRCP